MLRKIKLYGQLAEFIGHKEFEVQVDTVGKAVSFLIHNFPEVEAYMNPRFYQVKIGDYSISKEEISYPIGREDIHFIPHIAGSGSVGRIIGGIALVGIGIATGGAGFGLFSKVGWAGATFGTKALVIGGAALALGGVTDLLFPLPEPPEFSSSEDPQISFNFSGIQNTSRAGTPVPIVYGEIFTGSVVISAAVDTNQVEA